MVVTVFGIVTAVNPVHPLNALSPMLVILGPIVRFVKVSLPLNNDAGITPT